MPSQVRGSRGLADCTSRWAPNELGRELSQDPWTGAVDGHGIPGLRSPSCPLSGDSCPTWKMRFQQELSSTLLGGDHTKWSVHVDPRVVQTNSSWSVRSREDGREAWWPTLGVDDATAVAWQNVGKGLTAPRVIVFFRQELLRAGDQDTERNVNAFSGEKYDILLEARKGIDTLRVDFFFSPHANCRCPMILLRE